jgi:5-methylcytosine-specific restriction endonuclease McrA
VSAVDVAYVAGPYVGGGGALGTVLWVLLGFVGRLVPRDRQRLYTAQQKAILVRQARGRCEHTWLVLRCWRTDRLEADHVWPWSLGGRTSIRNGQILCKRHNARKSNRVPGPVYVWRARVRHR